MGCEVRFVETAVEDVITDIAMGPFGSNIKTNCFVSEGIPVFNGSNLTGFSTNDKALRYVTPEKAKSLGNALASRGDVVVTHRGTLGQIAYIPNDSQYANYIISQSQFRVKCNQNKILPEYLVYYFHTPLGQWKLLSNTTQTGVPALSRPTSTFKKLSIELPPVSYQAQVLETLQPIQRKMALNQRTNDYLERCCQALFDDIQNDHTNEVIQLSDVAAVNPKRRLSKGSLARCVEMSNLSTRGAFPNDWCRKAYNGGMKFMNGDTILARITPCLENGKTAYINFLDEGEVAFGSTEYIVLASEGLLPAEFFYFLARSRAFVSYATNHMNGSSGRQRVSAGDIETYRLRVPSSDQAVRFAIFAQPAMEEILNHSLENRRLSSLRDALLPKLMSGEIDVSKVELPTLPNNHLYVD
ncbi:restriction endonuclease subunit S [Bifidobacterium pullorum subsp. saeculare]|uniref:Restriction endonuclease subunit S n=1 Tax=Bifidobacterium pullorum subsp. saeculare TaxID=78257 RepID=A0A938WYI6_9BIFI|nr:restriction endonuclease subunit S [Bifidobacterium pullorum]MBM6699368.1 restriction endonuclease subunit S [Bifidobacterium pullorum subsp. saeculare]